MKTVKCAEGEDGFGHSVPRVKTVKTIRVILRVGGERPFRGPAVTW